MTSNLAKVRVSAALMDQCEPAIEDAVANLARGEPQSTDPVYLKLHHASSAKDGSVTIEADEADLHELLDRFDFELETCKDNIADTSDPYERNYYRARLRAAKAFIKRYRNGGL